MVTWQIYDITRDPMSLAYAGLAQFVPMLILLPYLGDVIDRFNRKYILAFSWQHQPSAAPSFFGFPIAAGLD